MENSIQLSAATSIFRDCPDCPEMIVIPAGSFDMGTNDAHDDEKPVHRVTISQPFALGKIEVTQAEWSAVMGGNPSDIRCIGDNYPVENVSWDDAQEFIRRLNQITGKQYRLPSEAEWEFACHAKGKPPYCGDDDVANAAWYGAGTTAAGDASKHCVQTNFYGLCDKSRNVWEWVEDNYHENYNGAPADGSIWQGDSAQRVLRGCSWGVAPMGVGEGGRIGCPPDVRSPNIGFRLARTLTVNQSANDIRSNVAARLELATAYQEMGDRAGASEELIQIVWEGGTPVLGEIRVLFAKLNAAPMTALETIKYDFDAIMSRAIAHPHPEILRAALLVTRAQGADWSEVLSNALTVSRHEVENLTDGLEMLARFGLESLVATLVNHEKPQVRQAAESALKCLGKPDFSAAALHRFSLPESPGLAHIALCTYLNESHEAIGLVALMPALQQPDDESALIDAFRNWPGAIPGALLNLLVTATGEGALPVLQHQWSCGYATRQIVWELCRIPGSLAPEMLINWLRHADGESQRIARLGIMLGDERFLTALLSACKTDDALRAREAPDQYHAPE